MSIPDIVRKLYLPSQPTSRSAQDVLYTELQPHPALRNCIYCYWELKTLHPLPTDFVYRVVADGCMDIFFDVDHPDEHFVMGFSNAYVQFPLGRMFHYIGIRFLPTMFPQCFGIDASELTNRFEHLGAVIPGLAQFISEQFGPDQELEQITQTLDTYFLRALANTAFDNDPRLYEAIGTILRNSGNTAIESGLQTGISPRQLRRLFTYYIGDSAKNFSKIVRFQAVLRHTRHQDERFPFLDHGYYDQAHFIKEFRHFYGTTPGKAFRG